MYQRYYASTDVQTYFTASDFSSIVKVDTAMAVSYSLQQTATPVYSLGSRKAQFYSQGNTLGQGTLTIAFTDEEYLKYCLNQIDRSEDVSYYQDTNDTGVTLSTVKSDTNKSQYTSKKTSNADFKNQAYTTRNLSTNDRIISIGGVLPLFNISLYINNETAITASDSKVINLIGVKIINETTNTSSTADAPLMITYHFMFKDVERG